ncbi:MAG: hypothetical protein KAT35_05470 [Candidatus Aenigmarchaeota archaeon]|nr:hypothetical protein [Candidatus Aenigmarchaeota archaeon]
MEFGFFNLILRKGGKRELVRAKEVVRPDPFEELVGSLGLRKNLGREELEGLVRRLEVNGADVKRHCKGKGKIVGRRVAAGNGLLECVVCEWPQEADVFSVVHGRGFEVLRIWSGKLVLTEHYFVRGKVEPYCVAELSAGSVVCLPPAVFYRIENKGKERACSLHFFSPPPGLQPASEGIRRLCKQGEIFLA